MSNIIDCDHQAPHAEHNGEWYCQACGEHRPDPPVERYTGCDAEFPDYDYNAEFEACDLDDFADITLSHGSRMSLLDDCPF